MASKEEQTRTEEMLRKLNLELRKILLEFPDRRFDLRRAASVRPPGDADARPIDTPHLARGAMRGADRIVSAAATAVLLLAGDGDGRRPERGGHSTSLSYLLC